ncbi:hypothetical protein PR048_026087 [Dryococelus australis]|uniref:Uncharacterized protein n=1 Tax=Dryococelus australis TaxID=614101 RepID=A0ABQ9GKB5_9NEOP|nr:hypothetical protein PR048_026087 [Dryococelus australis]
MEQSRNEEVKKTEYPRENPPTSGIVRHDCPRMRKSGSGPVGTRTRATAPCGVSSPCRSSTRAAHNSIHHLHLPLGDRPAFCHDNPGPITAAGKKRLAIKDEVHGPRHLVDMAGPI